MSRSNPTVDMRNPAVRFMEWSGSKGAITYYDKEKEEVIEVKLPFSFLILDQLNTITGFIETLNTGVWSNEVRDTRTDKLIVKTKMGIMRVALYEDLKDIIAKGAKFAKSIYIAFFDDNNVLQIGHLKFWGSAFSAWMDFMKKVSDDQLYKFAITVAGGKKKKKGTNTYFEPVFKLRKVSDETNAEAEALDVKLQTYLRMYLNQPVEVEDPQASGDDIYDDGFDEEGYAKAVAVGQPSPEDIEEMARAMELMEEDGDGIEEGDEVPL